MTKQWRQKTQFLITIKLPPFFIVDSFSKSGYDFNFTMFAWNFKMQNNKRNKLIYVQSRDEEKFEVTAITSRKLKTETKIFICSICKHCKSI